MTAFKLFCKTFSPRVLCKNEGRLSSNYSGYTRRRGEASRIGGGRKWSGCICILCYTYTFVYIYMYSIYIYICICIVYIHMYIKYIYIYMYSRYIYIHMYIYIYVMLMCALTVSTRIMIIKQMPLGKTDPRTSLRLN